jgi:hypothetical protein
MRKKQRISSRWPRLVPQNRRDAERFFQSLRAIRVSMKWSDLVSDAS